MPIHPPVEVAGHVWDWSETIVFGVLNVTPDSFSDGGQFDDVERAVARARELVAAGAHAIDVGGESTRPGSTPVPADEELARVLPVIERLASDEGVGVPISIDTYKAEVARAAVGAGASIVNDVSGLQLDAAMTATVAELGASVIIGHLRGEPATMMHDVSFDDVVAEVIDELKARVRQAVTAGIAAERIFVDPCFGFGKRAEHTLALLAATERLREEIGYPLMLGPSRKSFIGGVTGAPAQQRVMGTAAAAAIGIAQGAEMLRVHDVAELMPAIRVADAVRRA
ncbi:MAG: dihydropteroate synthase [Myxococcales bacterium]|nr:dihydropteroate synthase [Myxococcales bacterium]